MKSLTNPNIDLCFQRATRGDEGSLFNRTQCRGEFLETLLRIVKHHHQSEKKISMYIKDFLTEYLEPFYYQSKIYQIRLLVYTHF